MKAFVQSVYAIAITFFLYKAALHFGGIGAFLKGLGFTFDLAKTDSYGGYGFLVLILIGIIIFVLMTYKESRSNSTVPLKEALFGLVGPVVIVLFALAFLS